MCESVAERLLNDLWDHTLSYIFYKGLVGNMSYIMNHARVLCNRTNPVVTWSRVGCGLASGLLRWARLVALTVYQHGDTYQTGIANLILFQTALFASIDCT